MAAKLPAEILSQIAAHPGEPVPVVDDQGHRFYLISEERLTHLEAAAQEESEATLTRLRGLIAEGDASPDVPAEEARERVMRMAIEADRRHA